MVELAGRVPIQLSPRQSLLVGAVAAALLLAVLARGVIEAALIGVLNLILRLTGHQPPRRSSFSMLLDELEQQQRPKKDE